MLLLQLHEECGGRGVSWEQNSKEMTFGGDFVIINIHL